MEHTDEIGMSNRCTRRRCDVAVESIRTTVVVALKSESAPAIAVAPYTTACSPKRISFPGADAVADTSGIVGVAGRLTSTTPTVVSTTHSTAAHAVDRLELQHTFFFNNQLQPNSRHAALSRHGGAPHVRLPSATLIALVMLALAR